MEAVWGSRWCRARYHDFCHEVFNAGLSVPALLLGRDEWSYRSYWGPSNLSSRSTWLKQILGLCPSGQSVDQQKGSRGESLTRGISWLVHRECRLFLTSPNYKRRKVWVLETFPSVKSLK